jgi:hypothetical protein
MVGEILVEEFSAPAGFERLPCGGKADPMSELNANFCLMMLSEARMKTRLGKKDIQRQQHVDAEVTQPRVVQRICCAPTNARSTTKALQTLVDDSS